VADSGCEQYRHAHEQRVLRRGADDLGPVRECVLYRSPEEIQLPNPAIGLTY
jgi:hypothetical protein